MAEYIDKDKLIDRFDELCNTICQYSKKQRAVMCSSCELGIAFDVVDDFPAADVQPVVRCNECNLYDGVREVYGFASCTYWMQMTRWDDYCSHGVRKDGGQ